MKRSTFCFIGLLAVNVIAVPPYMWYSTYSIEDYEATGCPGNRWVYCSDYHYPECVPCDPADCTPPVAHHPSCPCGSRLIPGMNLSYSHDLAGCFSNAVESYVPSGVYKRYRTQREDAACTPDQWTGFSGEVNWNDFVLFAGHGSEHGPFFGCDPQYEIDQESDMRLGGDGYLKWMQANACHWFAPADKVASGKTATDRWDETFQGIHCIQGHRALGYDVEEVIDYYGLSQPDRFFYRWITYGYDIHSAWTYSLYWNMYEGGLGGTRGIEPATMGANSDYAFETWWEAGDNPAPVNGNKYLTWTTYGNPW